MEVHHHSSHAAGSQQSRKKWTHYFWEFLMLFLAVFCGFLAEYQLEHKIEKSREKQYIKSFVEDLEADTFQLDALVANCQLSANRADSLIVVLGGPDKDKMAGEIYYFLRLLHRSSVFSVNDRTMVQLRNAGGMRLVSNKTVSDSMVSYYREVDFIKFIYEEQTEIRRSLRPYFPRILDGIDFGKFVNDENTVIRINEPVKIKFNDEEAVNAILLICQQFKGINSGIKRRLTNLKEKAKIIRDIIVKEYRLQ
jgi:hypothetical protein